MIKREMIVRQAIACGMLSVSLSDQTCARSGTLVVTMAYETPVFRSGGIRTLGGVLHMMEGGREEEDILRVPSM